MNKPFFRKQTQAWYVWEQDGKSRKLVRLAKDKTEALRFWHERQVFSEPLGCHTTVETVVTRFLDWCKRHRAEDTYAWYKLYLDVFVQRFGKMPISELRAAHVEDWLDESYGHCSNTGRNGVVRAIVRPFNFAVKRGLLDKSADERSRAAAGRATRVLHTAGAVAQAAVSR